MKASELKKILKKGGCYFVQSGKKHDIWYSPKTGNELQIPRHDSKEVATGTANDILKDAWLK